MPVGSRPALPSDRDRGQLGEHPGLVDVRPVAHAAGVVVETMVALVLARAALEKFGGDSLAETKANIASYLAAVREREPQAG